jgi:hypothetical protein
VLVLFVKNTGKIKQPIRKFELIFATCHMVQYSISFWYSSLRILEQKLLHSPKHRWWLSILLLLLVYVFSPSFRLFVRFGKALEGWCEADWVVGGCVRLCSWEAGQNAQLPPHSRRLGRKDTTQAVRGRRKITPNKNIHPKYSILYLRIITSDFLFQLCLYGLHAMISEYSRFDATYKFGSFVSKFMHSLL